MIYKTFNPNQDIVAGRVTRIASGFWPNGLTNWSQSMMVDDFWDITGSSGNPSYGTSYYDVRRTMYYVNMFPEITYKNNSDPYFTVAYGHIAGELGSGSFAIETGSIKTSPTKAIYSQYKNMLLGTSDLDGMFSMKTGSTTIDAQDIWAIDFSAYKMKDHIDEGLLEFSLNGPVIKIPLIDDSRYTSQNQSVYQIISGSLDILPPEPTYEGLGLFYPTNGTIILNAAKIAEKIGLSGSIPSAVNHPKGIALPGVSDGPGTDGTWPYYAFTDTSSLYTYNHRTLATSLKKADSLIKIRKSEYVPTRHYFVRVMNREFNYSNNPTYVYDGTDNEHPKGMIKITDFITDPKTYITSVGLYNENNELVAIAKLSRPAVKSFDSELLIKIKLDF